MIIMITIGLLTLLSNFIIEGNSDNLDNVTRWVNDDSLLWFGGRARRLAGMHAGG